MTKEIKALTKNIIAMSDSRYQFKKLYLGLKEEFKPKDFYEHLLVDKLATDYWRLKKALTYQDHLLQHEQADNLKNNALNQVVALIKSIEKSIEKGKKDIKETKNDKRFSSF